MLESIADEGTAGVSASGAGAGISTITTTSSSNAPASRGAPQAAVGADSKVAPQDAVESKKEDDDGSGASSTSDT